MQSIFFNNKLTVQSITEVLMSLETFQNLQKQKQATILKKGIEVFSKCSFTDANTDLITQKAGISKGLLFHYFGSKKDFYLYLLDYALELLSQIELSTKQEKMNNFYEILFDSMDRKIQLISQYPNEMHFVNLAARETSKQVAAEKQELISRYMLAVQKNSMMVLSQAISTLNMRNDIDKQKLTKGLSVYVNAIITQFLKLYETKPQEFFDNSDSVKSELKEYIDLMLEGVEVKKHD